METNKPQLKLVEALVKFQGEVGSIQKKSVGVHGAKYAQLADVMKEVLPALNKNGLAVTQWPTQIEGQPALRTILHHSSGESIEDTMPLILPKQDPQGQGSAITYARRYSLASILGLVIDEDDDGQKATDSVSKSNSVAPAPKVVQPPKRPSDKATEAQIKLLMARARDFSGLALKEDVVRWFKEKTGLSPMDVKKSEVDDILKLMEEEKDV